MEYNKTTYAEIKPGDTITTPNGVVTITHTEDNGTSITLYIQGGGVLIGHPSEGLWIGEANSLGESDIMGLLRGFESDNRKGRGKDERPKESKRSPGWHQDGSYTTPSGVTYTAGEMGNAAYDGVDLST